MTTASDGKRWQTKVLFDFVFPVFCDDDEGDTATRKTIVAAVWIRRFLSTGHGKNHKEGSIIVNNKSKIVLKTILKTVRLFFKKWANPGFLLFIFELIKQKIYRKTIGFSEIRTQIVGVEGVNTDHLTTTTQVIKTIKL